MGVVQITVFEAERRGDLPDAIAQALKHYAENPNSHVEVRYMCEPVILCGQSAEAVMEKFAKTERDHYRPSFSVRR